MASQATILIIGTLETKLDEILYLRSQIVTLSSNDCKVQILDVSRDPMRASTYSTTPNSEFISPPLESSDALKRLARDEYVEKMVTMCIPIIQKLVSDGSVHAVLSVGGIIGSSLAGALMRDACPIGFPKMIVSTVASGDVRPYIENTDITIMPSVVDIAGLNSILKKILTNAAGAISGMAMTHASMQKNMEALRLSSGKKIAVTMSGVTTQCVDKIRKILTTTPHDVSEHEIYVFRATGSGGKAMERLISEKQIDAVVDLTVSEVVDELLGGVLSAGSQRLECAVKQGIPMIVSVGACDMVNFGPMDTISDSAKGRNLYRDSPSITLMRTSESENVKMAKFITSKLKGAVDPKKIRVLLPKGGVSMFDYAEVEKPSTSSSPPTTQTRPLREPIKGTTGQPWHDPKADTALFTTIMKELDGTNIEVFEYPDNINDDPFAVSICEHLLEVMSIDPRQYRLANARRRKWSFDHGPSLDKIRRRNSIEVPDA